MREFFLPNYFFKRCLVLTLFDAYQLRRKIFFLLGLPFTPPYLRIYEGIFLRTTARCFSLEGGDHKHHLENFSVGGLTLTPSNVRICERTFPRQNLIPKLPLSWWPKASPKVVSEVFSETGFTKRGLKVGISEGTFKKVSEPGLTLPPPHFRISERIFKNLSLAPWLLGAQMSEYMKASFDCTLTIEYPPSGGPQPRRRCTYTDEREMPVRTTGGNLLDDGLKKTQFYIAFQNSIQTVKNPEKF